MQSKSYRIDRFISKKLGINRRDIKLMLAQGRVLVNGKILTDVGTVVGEFDRVVMDETILQDNQAIYLMMNKPVGVVSATRDEQHKTVLDLVYESDLSNQYSLEQLAGLHIVGRLDLNTSGLLLLTNDGQWSRRIMMPEKKVPKVYQVSLQNPLSEEYATAFAQGMFFSFENIITKPAKLMITSERTAEVTLEEGKYHQIKRMFGRFRNPVLSLHRSQVGNLCLPKDILPGKCRALSGDELSALE